MLAAATFAAAAFGATVSYTPQGSAPYYWSDTAAWGGAEPGPGDEALVNNSLLLANPLVVATGTSASVGTNRMGNCILQIENGASLSTGSGSIFMAGAANQTCIVTNYGTVSVNDLQLGVYDGTGRGTLAQFDNFGTLTIGTWFRIGIRGTRSIFYNHEGATFNKTGGGAWTFYLATGGGLSTIINEGTMVCGPGTETWSGNYGGPLSEIIMRKSGTFDPGPYFKIGHAGGSVTKINLYDNSKILGNTKYNVGAENAAEGYITLSNDSSFVTSGQMYLGVAANSVGKIALADNASAKLLGRAFIGHASLSSGAITLTDNSSLEVNSGSEVVYLGYSAGSTGLLSLDEHATADIQSPFFVGAMSGARGTITLAGNSQLYVTNCLPSKDNDGKDIMYSHELIVGYAGGATGVLNAAENAVLHAPNLYIGQSSGAGTAGFVTLSDSATLFATNICIPRWGDPGEGTLTVAGNSVVTNVQMLRLAYRADATIGVGKSGTLAMRGGSVFFDVDPTSPDYIATGRSCAISLNGYLSTVKGRIRGWGKIAFSDPRTYVTEAAVPSGLAHYGQVIADGEGVMRDLDFGRFGAFMYASTDANPSGTNGWFAVNKGRLKLPRSLPNRSGYKCVGDCFNANVDLGVGARRLANTFNYEFTGAETNHFVFSELYAVDREDIPAGLGDLGADKVIAVWRIGYFSDGPEVDDPENPVPFTSAKLKFKYSPDGVDGLNFVHVYRHDGTADGEWKRCGKLFAPSTAMPIVSTRPFEQSSENWNLGWFAIVGRVERPSGMIITVK